MSPVAAIKTLEKGRLGYWISTADRERGEKKGRELATGMAGREGET